MRIQPKIAVIFVLCVLVPSFILGILAVRAIDMQEAYIEKQIEGTVSAEILHHVTLINNRLKEIEDDLSSIFDAAGNGDDGTAFLPDASEYEVIGIPYLLSPDLAIMVPDQSGRLSGEEAEFIEENALFLTDKAAVPVYENIAVAYSDVIMDEITRKKDIQQKKKEEDTWDTGGSSATNDNGMEVNDDLIQQTILNEFEQSKEIRNKVYDRASEEGQEVLMRNVTQMDVEQKEKKNPESVFIQNDRTFSQIREGSEHGIIPRIISGSLELLFWKKAEGGGVSGCLIDTGYIRDEVAAVVIPSIFSSIRILTVLDENGTPLIRRGADIISDWKTPFASREISTILPRWEVAAYLTDPSFISEEAGVISLIMWILILILIVAITTGGFVVLKSYYSGITLAQQKTTFVSNVSHELKTPLTSIRLFAEMLRENRQTDEEKRRQYLSYMVSETERLTRLINNVLDFSKMGQGTLTYTMERADIVEVCREIIEGQRLRFGQSGFSLSFIEPNERIEVTIDEEAVKQAFLNLLSNAFKYSDAAKEIEVEIKREGGEAVVLVKDRGIGIPSGEAKKIFREFYRVDDRLTSRVRGSGLGLAISRKIITDHGGEVTYAPRPGGGSIFRIGLPVAGRKGACDE
ncbi:MAG: HAMP domain-containing histidine kinase [Spirochaetales bacterium]|nr:HAMP domain-containing histidine kinase [Spirochaetales bacterium]